MSVAKREQCPKCAETGGDTKRDNLVTFDDGGGKCFACGYLVSTDAPHGFVNTTVTQSVLVEEKIHEYKLPKRGISERTCKFWGAGVNLVSDRIILQYKDSFGKNTWQKVRTSDRSWYTVGHKESHLYGQWLWEPNPQLGLVITEGEIDALSISEVQEDKWPVVSIPTGAQSAKQCLQTNLKWLQGFKHVTLAFDNDEAGMKATAECVELFQPGKVKVANWGTLKDANDVLMTPNGRSVIQNTLLRARTHMPEKIITVHDIKQRILEKPGLGRSWPWPTMTDLTRGVRPQELTVLMGPQSVGKTTISLQCVHHMAFYHGVKCGIMSFEQSAEETYQVLAGMQINKNLLDPATPWAPGDIEAALESMDNRVYTCDDLSPQSFTDIKNWIMYFAVALECEFLLIDNLSNIAVTFDRDEQRGIQKAMVALFDLARILDTHILLMTHVTDHNKTSRTHEEGKPLKASDARGSDSIGQHCTAMFGAERNAIHEDPLVRNTLTMRCLKMRKVGSSRGRFFRLSYDATSGKLNEHSEFEVI